MLNARQFANLGEVMSTAIGIKAASKVLSGSKRIEVPFGIVKNKYALAVADLMEILQKSDSAHKSKLPEDFSWAFDYIQPPDPETTNKTEFVDHLLAGTKVYLVAWGYRWKGIVEVEEIPPQVKHRYEERARIVCVERVNKIDDDIKVPVFTAPLPKANAGSVVYGELNAIISLINELQAKHSIIGPEGSMLKIARNALETVKALRK